MKLVTMTHHGAMRLGALIARGAQNYILDLKRAHPDLPGDMLQFLQAGETALVAAQRAVANADERALIPQAEIR